VSATPAFLPRAVLDTNVLFAGLRSRRGASFAVLDALWPGKWKLILSNTISTEYEEILKRDPEVVGLSNQRINQLLDGLCAIAERRNLSQLWSPVLDDPDDEAFVHLAVEARADYLISHNLRHLAPARQLGVKLLAPRDFLAIIRS
jgi:putative PIN family toxin of toxin-antitoxin system